MIWYCLPLDNRPLSDAEMKFFEGGTAGPVPVLAILTKRDAMEFEKFGVALGSKTMRQATQEEKKEAWSKAHHQTNTIVEDYLACIKSTKFPPAAHMCLQKMHQDSADCSELTRLTAKALTKDVLFQLFALVQQNSFDVAVEGLFQGLKDKFFQSELLSKTNEEISRRVIEFCLRFLENKPLPAADLRYDDDDPPDYYTADYYYYAPNPGYLPDHLSCLLHALFC